ncbi:DNA-binding MarR family transcriptional regulator [Nakamurella sp. UYEF19]|uniref:MarR family winged helix-turn-helix transcriptional regulator n=1 Tax=Nakamurella sp. UYEF19 TaxID=1756392 RepID=UPI00339506FA
MTPHPSPPIALDPGRRQVAAWQAIREMVMEHLAVRRAEISHRLGVSFIKAKALRRLSSGPLTMGELTASLGTDPPYTSVVVGDLVDRRLAVRATHPSDRRRKIIDLTPAGREMADLAQEILDRPPAGFTNFSAEELEHLVTLFARTAGVAVSRGRRSPR